jgi:hypothetical protein
VIGHVKLLYNSRGKGVTMKLGSGNNEAVKIVEKLESISVVYALQHQ